MAKSFQVQELRYRTETSFCENINDLNSNTYAARLPLQGLPTVTLTQPRIADESMVNALHQRYPGYAGVREGELEFTVFATGHVTSTASGALTSSHWLYTLLSKGLGGGNTGDTGTDIDTGAGTPDADTIYTTANPGDFAAGSILRVGSKGDGRGDGQAAAVSTVSSQTVELLTALPGSAADEDVVYAALVAYPASVGHTDLGGTTASLAFIASNLDTGAQWHLLGCELMGLSLNLSIGSPPTLTFRYKVAWWARDADTTPSAVALATQNTGPWAGGDGVTTIIAPRLGVSYNVTGDGRTVGRVAELLIDPGAMQARYLDVALDEEELELEPVDRHILVPSDRVRLDRKKKKVVLAGRLAPDLADYPQYGGLPFRHRQEKELEEYFRRAGASKREPGARPESGPSDDWRVHTLRTFYETRPRTRRTTTKEE